MIKTLPIEISYFERNKIKRILVNFFEIEKDYFFSQVCVFQIKNNPKRFFIFPLILMVLVSFQNYAQSPSENSLSKTGQSICHEKEITVNTHGQVEFASYPLTSSVRFKVIQDLKYTIATSTIKSELAYNMYVRLLNTIPEATSVVNTNVKTMTTLTINETAALDKPNATSVITKLFSLNYIDDIRWC